MKLMNLLVQILIMLSVGVTAWFAWAAGKLKIVNVMLSDGRASYLFSDGVLITRIAGLGGARKYLTSGGKTIDPSDPKFRKHVSLIEGE